MLSLSSFTPLRNRWIAALSIAALVYAPMLTLGCNAKIGKDKSAPTAAAPKTRPLAPGSTPADANGEDIWKTLRDQFALDQSPAGQAKLAVWDQNHDRLVKAFAKLLPPSVTSGMVSVIQEMFALVDDGTVPAMLQEITDVLDLLLHDPNDPNQEAVGALLELSQAKSPLDLRSVTDLVARLLHDPSSEKLLDGLLAFIREHDGVDALGKPNGEQDLLGQVIKLLSTRLKNMQAPVQATGGKPLDLGAILLAEARIRSSAHQGPPAYIVQLGADGRPKVALDPGTGKLQEPFVDRNGDGLADVNAQGERIDQAGLSVDLAPFGRAGNRDLFGRALSIRGDPVFEYQDAKKSVLAALLQLGGDALRSDADQDALIVAQALLGPRFPSHAGTPFDPSDDYQAFSARNPLREMLYGGLELQKLPEFPKLLTAIAALLDSDPAAAEKLILQALDLKKKLAHVPTVQATVAPSQTQQMLRDLMPMLDEVFERRGSNGRSAGRIVLQAFATEFGRLQHLPAGFADMMAYTDYKNRIPTAPSLASSMEKLLALQAEADTCNALIIGNVAEFYIDAMAGNNKSILGIKMGIKTINKLVSISIIRNLLCSKISATNVPAIQDFADSGALDAFIPIAKSFSDIGETRLLVDIMLTLHRYTPTVMRPLEPMNVEMLRSGAVASALKLLRDTNTIQVPGTSEVVADVLADTIGKLVDDDGTVLDAYGARAPSLAQLLLAPMDRVQQNLRVGGAEAALDRLLGVLARPLTQTTTNTNGTPFDPKDDFQELTNPYILGVLTKGARLLADHLEPDATKRATELSKAQADLATAFESAELALVFDLWQAFAASPSRPGIKDGLLHTLTPGSSQADDVFGALLQVIAGALQTKTPQQATQSMAHIELLRFLGRIMERSSATRPGLLAGLMRLTGLSGGKMLPTLLRGLFDQGAGGVEDAPLLVLIEVFGDMGKAGGAAAPKTKAEMAQKIQQLVDKMRDPNGVVQTMLTDIKNRRR